MSTKSPFMSDGAGQNCNVTLLLPQGCSLMLSKLAEQEELMISEVVVLALAHYKAYKDAVTKVLQDM